VGSLAVYGEEDVTLYGLIAFGGTLTLLDNLGLYDVTDVVDEIKSFGGN